MAIRQHLVLDSPRGKYLAQLFDAVNVFVGRRRGRHPLRQRIVPAVQPFEGARMEITSRF